MGSGDNFTIDRMSGIGLGLRFSRFPFSFTIDISFIIWHISLGFGKGYDE